MVGTSSANLPVAVPGCNCCVQALGCKLETCPCGYLDDGLPAYCPSKRLRHLVNGFDQDLCVYECGPSCSCPSACPNRVSQQDPCPSLLLCEYPGKGLGVKTCADLPVGTYVARYDGECITTTTARARLVGYDALGGGHALLVIREQVSNSTVALRLNIDATNTDCLGKYFNHSCDGGNLVPVMVRMVGDLVPRVVFYARRDIAAGEELTFSYGPPQGPVTFASQKRCMCNTTACQGYLPREDV